MKKTIDNEISEVEQKLKINPVYEFMSFWADLYLEKMNIKYLKKPPPREWSHVKAMLAETDLYGLKAMAEEFFNLDDKYIDNNMGHTITALYCKRVVLAERLAKPKQEKNWGDE